MCLIVLAWRQHPDYPLVVAANRDEFHARPTAPAAEWPDSPGVFGGRDLSAGGTWLGVSASGRFAAVTNVREPGRPPGQRSRGMLTADFLCSQAGAGDYVSALRGETFAGFNLLAADGRELWYFSNRSGPPRRLPPGIYGLSNHLLDTPWPKLSTAKLRFAEALARLPDDSGFFRLLADDEIVPDERLPSTGVSLEWERMLSAIFVRSPQYGTRASTLLHVDRHGRTLLHERSFDPEGQKTGDAALRFVAASPQEAG